MENQHNTHHAEQQETHISASTNMEHAHAAGSKTVLYVIDIGILFFGILIIIVLQKTALGKRLGKLLTLINIGIVAIAANHLIDTLILHDALSGKVIWNHQAVLLGHHIGNLIGFFLIFLGYYLANKNFNSENINKE